MKENADMTDETTPLYRMENDPSKPAVSRDQWISDFLRTPGWNMDSAIALFDRMTRAGTLKEVQPHA